MGAVGAAVAWQRYEIALVLAFTNFATLRWLGPALKTVGEGEGERGKP